MYIEGPYFKDDYGRTLMLRGVNLGGSSKIPAQPNLPTHIKFRFYENKISFVGRPFPLKEADEHFKRLKSWGFTFLRFLVTWEAIEHEGPGIYDEAYLDYLYEVIKKAQTYDIQVFIDPHQDVWSRFSGGSGAPRWTFEKVGLDVKYFADSDAAILHHTYEDHFPDMIWPTNYTKLACATMFTLFFGGNDFAPEVKIDEIPAQEYLQTHYINAIKQVALRLKNLSNVVGFDTFNEPSAGWIGWQDLNSNAGFPLRKGASPSPFESMVLGAGNPLEVENWDFSFRGLRKKGTVKVNPRGIKAWMSGYKCIWRMHGIWDLDKKSNPMLIKPDYFAEKDGKKVDFKQDYLFPFIQKYTQEIRSVMPNAIIFVEPAINDSLPQFSEKIAKNLVNASHWYDVITLMTKNFRSWLSVNVETGKIVFGRKKVRKLFAQQLAKIKQQSSNLLNNSPTLIGEIGIPMDLQKKKAFKTGNFTRQIKAIDASMRAIEENLLHITIWNYTSDNNNEYGDNWNKEDLSIFSKSQQADKQDINSGGRALAALLRPYPKCIAGTPIRMSFDIRKQVFEFEFESDNKITQPTEFYVPNYQYPKGYKVFVSDGEFDMDIESQTLIYRHSSEKSKHTLKILRI